jgi:xylulokinase
MTPASRISSSAERHGDLFVGVDVGTSGVKALATTGTGEVVARRAVDLDASACRQEGKTYEQDPEAWWRATCEALTALAAHLTRRGISTESLKALAVDGTSGTLVCTDQDGGPLRPAIMYNDGRAAEAAEALNDIAGEFCVSVGYRFAASYALAKILWVLRDKPEIFERTRHFAHQADFVVARLTGELGVSDYSNALKTGYDLIEERWPSWMSNIPGLLERLPRILAPGTVVGHVSRTAAEATGLPEGLHVVTGASDGTAACIASGIHRAGDYNTTLGTTLVFKGISLKLCKHPEGLIYSHKLPGGFWLPGAASNTGAEWIPALFPDADLKAMDAAACGKLPTAFLAYPLVREGERFPFLSGLAEGFCTPKPEDHLTRYTACLQGVALVERLGYQVLDEVTGFSDGEVFSTGGGSQSDIWMQCRADATGRVMHRPACPESAFGSAVLAATGITYPNLWDAVRNMVRIEKTYAPDEGRAARYTDLFDDFCQELRKRDYL